MNVKYYKEDDILVITLSKKSYDHAEMEGSFVVHFTKDKHPVRIEILDASQFLTEESKALPSFIKQKYFLSA
ncbi:DUF2283 domain-containing protein [Candidatus Roizmanbacteria bacterium]|nr:DUF2283 domain-containing protein [Candidatus Roizmanbacteria bacterium]